MIIPQNIRPFWDTFQAAVGPADPARFYEAFHFDDNERDADELADLVLAGTKCATAALLWSYEAEGRPPPAPGALSVVTRWVGEPVGVVESVSVDVLPYEAVTAGFAATEGEGDRSLRHWREVHWAYFGRECERLGKVPDLRMPVVCETFRLVYPAPGARGAPPG